MKTLFAIFIAICSAIWVYGSLRFYSCIRSETCDYGVSNPNLEITIMLLGAFIFGYLFGNLLSGLRKRKYIKRSQIDDLKGSYTQSKKYGLYQGSKTKATDTKNEEFDFSETYSNIDKATKVDTGRNQKIIKSTVDKKITFTDNNKNKEVSSLGDGSTKNIRKKGLFGNFLDDVNLSNEIKDESVNQEVDTVKENFVDNPSSKKTTKISNKTQSPKKTQSKSASIKKGKDDLTKIEGIGPKIAELLNNNNIFTFVDLARTDPFLLSKILTSAGSRFQMHNPKTWPQQSVYAAKGEWDTLKKYQEKLNGGRA